MRKITSNSNFYLLSCVAIPIGSVARRKQQPREHKALRTFLYKQQRIPTPNTLKYLFLNVDFSETSKLRLINSSRVILAEWINSLREILRFYLVWQHTMSLKKEFTCRTECCHNPGTIVGSDRSTVIRSTYHQAPIRSGPIYNIDI